LIVIERLSVLSSGVIERIPAQAQPNPEREEANDDESDQTVDQYELQVDCGRKDRAITRGAIRGMNQAGIECAAMPQKANDIDDLPGANDEIEQ
jgi:hypothetical protein